jgi:cruciform cutting endonuclease 1
MSQLTLNLVQSHLLPLRPTHVLIERQRFRTGGAAAIFEWTLRVNTLEAMLHAVFASLNGRRQGGVGWEGKVESVLPRGVVGFLFPGGAADAADVVAERGGEDWKEGLKGEKGKKKKGKAGKAYQMLKREKVDVLGRLLRDEGMVIPQEGQAGEMVRLFLGEWEKKGVRKGRRTKKGEDEGEKMEEALTKMDDLSDAVLQGMAWLQWQRNLGALIKERPELLEDGDDE